jgi:hypothetical protein
MILWRAIKHHRMYTEGSRETGILKVLPTMEKYWIQGIQETISNVE